MKFAVEVGGRTLTVDVVAADLQPSPKASAKGTVTLDGRPFDVDVAVGEPFWSLLIDGRSYEVAFGKGEGRVTLVHVDGRAVPVAVIGAGQFAVARSGRGVPDGPDGVHRLIAPMPGRIVKLLARVGDAVNARQGVVVIEAMKMENELRSPKSGTVTELPVAEGTSVEAGAVLAVIE